MTTKKRTVFYGHDALQQKALEDWIEASPRRSQVVAAVKAIQKQREFAARIRRRK